MAKDYYEILETTKSATADEIKKNYRKLARKYHPDVNPGDKDAENKFKELSEAYAVLSDPEKRKEYDSVGHDAFTNSGHGYNFQNMNYEDMRNFNFGGTSFEDLFGDIFGNLGGGRRRRTASSSRKGEDITYSIRIPFADAVKGSSYEINVNRTVKCPSCGGTGGKKSVCTECGGSGVSKNSRGFFQTSCEACGGTGEKYTEACKTCGTSGFVSTSERIKVSIPAGVGSGSKIRLAGKGNASSGSGPDGDLYIITEVASHPVYERNGADLSVNVPIDIFEAALGAKITVPTPYGDVSLNIPPGTQNGQKFRLKGKGMPVLKKDAKGDLYVIAKVIIPKAVTEEERKKLQEIMDGTRRPDRSDLLAKGRI